MRAGIERELSTDTHHMKFPQVPSFAIYSALQTRGQWFLLKQQPIILIEFILLVSCVVLPGGFIQALSSFNYLFS